MPCYRPLKGYRSRTFGPSGKRAIVFAAREGLYDQPVDLPCGQCIGCRLERSRQWAIRCVHEASLYDRNCFITLTYDDDHLPANGSLDPDAPVGWLKRVRDRYGAGIRSFGCAEYGEKFQRPHYHVILFNFDFEDKVLFKRSSGFDIFTSDSLSETWPFGHSSVAGFSFETAAYVARYCTKKVVGRKVDVVDDFGNFICSQSPAELEHYGDREPERSVCVSRRPGLGKRWYESFGAHSRAHDFIVLRGLKMKPPKYYDRLFDLDFPSDFAKRKSLRKNKALALSELEPVPVLGQRDRLSVKEICHELKFKQLKRSYERG